MLCPLIPILAQAAAHASVSSGDAPSNWAPVVLLIIIGLLFGAGSIIGSILVGPSRTGPAKETIYESGMLPIGDTRRRFNVRFYIVAMIFLVIDVEIVFFYPWATIFAPVIRSGSSKATTLLVEMIVFVVILLVAYIYAWGKGVFRWD
jgi:NADH-quinone oxidoreductase subunit A